MSKGIVKIEDLKIENIKLSEIRDNKRGGKVVYINYDYEDGRSPSKLIMQLPRLKVPFGVSGWDQSASKGIVSNNSNDFLEISLGENKEIIEKLKKIEAIALKFGIDNTKKFRGKTQKPDVIKEFFNANVKYSKDKEGNLLEYPPRLKCKLLKNENGEYLTKFFYDKNNKVAVNIDNYKDCIPKMSDCSSIIECSNIWCVSEKFGLTFRPSQIKIYKNENVLDSYAFGDEDESDEEVEEVEALEEEINGLDLESDELDA